MECHIPSRTRQKETEDILIFLTYHFTMVKAEARKTALSQKQVVAEI
jgi:hypothetical protein